jgi:CO dehydrogenase maturation factor
MIMKILICGKGGCGKSTVVALLAKELAMRENRVLVIDSDESNIGLAQRLGMDKPADFMNYFGGKKILFEKARQIANK